MVKDLDSRLWAQQFVKDVMGLKSFFLPLHAIGGGFRAQVEEALANATDHLDPLLHPEGPRNSEIPQAQSVTAFAEILPSVLRRPMGALAATERVFILQIFETEDAAEPSSRASARALMQQMLQAIDLSAEKIPKVELTLPATTLAEGASFLRTLFDTKDLFGHFEFCLVFIPVEWMTELVQLKKMALPESEDIQSWASKFIFTYSPSACLHDPIWKRPTWNALKDLKLQLDRAGRR